MSQVQKAWVKMATAGGVSDFRVLTPESIRRAHTEQTFGPDVVLGVVSRLGLGFALNQPAAPLGPNPRTFGHPGAGGSIGFADPDARLGFGYTMNQMGSDALIDGRAANLFNALFAAL